MFFRVVRTTYKDKQYKYLKLLESVRRGRQVRQRQVYNLGNVSHLTDEQLADLVCRLEKVMSLTERLTGYELSWGKFPRTSFLLALEFCLNPGPPGIDWQVIKKCLHEEKVRRVIFRQGASAFWAALAEHWPHFQDEKKLVVFTSHLPPALVHDKNILLDIAFSSRGYPLNYKIAEGLICQLKNFLSQINESFTDNTFAVVASERAYNNYVLPVFQQAAAAGQEILLHRQSINWLGRLVGQSCRMYYLDLSGGRSVPSTEAVRLVVDYMNYQDALLAGLAAFSQQAGDGQSDIMDILITSYFFKQCLQHHVDLALLQQK
ncbi:MAG: hypothetical protein ACUVTU_12665 [Desulfurispora sp.]|uniref:hypothetical protein n=1 Tax=Desulfurispora sp. TaxID=3014275 RepID=UPI0040491479